MVERGRRERAMEDYGEDLYLPVERNRQQQTINPAYGFSKATQQMHHSANAMQITSN